MGPLLLEELVVEVVVALPWLDSTLARFLTRCSSPRGWKTIGLSSFGKTIGPQTIDAVLKQAPTLENIRISRCELLTSPKIQQLLTTAPNLRRLNLIPSFGDALRMEPYMLMAADIISSEWVCTRLESFKCLIGGIIRPNLLHWPVIRHPRRAPVATPTTPEHESVVQRHQRPFADKIPGWSSMILPQKSRAIERKVMEQFSRLHALVEISLGLVKYAPTIPDLIRDEDSMASAFPTRYFRGLTMQLENGLDLLEDLKKLRKIRMAAPHPMATGLAMTKLTQLEQDWVKEHWPQTQTRLQESSAADGSRPAVAALADAGTPSVRPRDKFWTERGIGMRHETVCYYMPQLGVSGVCNVNDAFDFDWW
ncbi:hypothetical protein BGZ83_006731 [Gryganskiella cystojenkinii]|nr:hypothetical protein BGZ83_006731 [Gryganskiella cystojenkinii]